VRASHSAAQTSLKVLAMAAVLAAGIVEWDSLDDAVAFYKSKAWADLAAQRNKAVKVAQRYVVETEK